MAEGFFAYLSRLRYIDRWSLMRNTCTETVQDHSYMTAVLAHGLGVIRREIFGLPAEPERAAAAALFHDGAEVFTGDLPTPVKYYTRELRQAYGVVESAAQDKLLGSLPEALRPAYDSLVRETEDAEVMALVKAADKLSAYLKCAEECKAGNREFSSALEQTRRAVEALERPEVAYFLAQFFPAFSLDLDQMTQGGGQPTEERTDS